MDIAAVQTMDEAFRLCRDLDAPLARRLTTYVEAVRRLNPAYHVAAERLVERLTRAASGASAPQPGELMPAFLLPDDTGRLVSLDSLLQRGPIALTFHRGHWCPFCRLAFDALVKAQARIAGEGLQIVVVMPELQRFTSAFKTEQGAQLTILSDLDNGYALSLNLAIWLGDEMKERLQARADRNIPEYQGNDAFFVPIPATFVVGTDGRVAARFVDPDYRKRMDLDDMIAALRGAR
jgi:peroxiredoxin